MSRDAELEIDAARISTPKDDCVRIENPKQWEAELLRLEKGRYDFAPVLNGETLLGLIARSRLAELAKQARMITPQDVLRPSVLQRHTTVIDVVEALAKNPTALIFSDGTEWQERSWWGLLSTADLNRHYFRSRVYMLLAEIEEGLANAIKNFGNSYWIKSIGDRRQTEIGLYSYRTRKGGAERSPVDACTLKEMFEIAANDVGIRGRVGFNTKEKFLKYCDGLVNLRNKIMHPVRPMISGQADVHTLRDRLRRIEVMIQRIDGLPIPCSPSGIRKTRTRAASAV